MSGPGAPAGGAAAVAETYRRALEAADIDAVADLCDPLVRWGPLEYPDAGCHNRKDALRFYRQGKAAGARATVAELTLAGERMLVGLRVTGMAGAENQEVEVWQVVRVRAGVIVDISGCDDRAMGAAALGIP